MAHRKLFSVHARKYDNDFYFLFISESLLSINQKLQLFHQLADHPAVQWLPFGAVLRIKVTNQCT